MKTQHSWIELRDTIGDVAWVRSTDIEVVGTKATSGRTRIVLRSGRVLHDPTREAEELVDALLEEEAR